MIKRVTKRSLSIFLTLVLLATTFFIFDPSVLKMNADAIIDVETNAGLVSITTPQAVAPETIYLKPGANEFQYFSNIDVTGGKAAGSKDSTGTVSYKDQSSTDTKLYVNNLWHRTSKTGTGNDDYENFAISNLQLGITGGVGSQTSITLAGLSATNTTLASGATVIGRGSNSATAILNTQSRLLNATPGEVYIIEWVAVSTINSQKHLKFMYTGIYVPLLDIAGTSGRGHHSTMLTNVPKAAGFGFITGAMAYSDVSNRYNGYTGTTFGVNCAPLVGFVGQQNNGTAGQYTIPNLSNGQYAAFPTTGTGKKTILATTGDYDGTNNVIFTSYSSWGSYADPTPSGTNSGDLTGQGGTGHAPVAYEVVDTSRFTNFSQIPNLSVGYIRYYHDRGGDYCRLSSIKLHTVAEYDTNDHYTGISAAGVDTGNHDDNEDSWRSRTYGLYSLSGAVSTGNKGYYVINHYEQDITTYNYPINLWLMYGLYVQGVNKGAQREGYCAYLTSVVDNVNDSSYSTTYGNMLTQARRLCDPTCTDADTEEGCTKSEIETKSNSIVSANSGSLYFHVPETIYINPNNNNFQYYVNYKAQDTMETLAEATATSGNFYFHYKGASKVTAIFVEALSGGASLSSMTLGGQSLSSGKFNVGSISGASSANINTTITAGSLSSYTNTKLKWTVYYVDKASNKVQSVTAYTYCYCGVKIGTSSVVSVMAHSRDDSGANHSVGVTAWITGCNTIDAVGYTPTSASSGSNNTNAGDARGSYKHNYIQGNAVPTVGNKSASVFDSGNGGSGYWSSDSDVNYYTGGKGTLYVDSSRYTDMGHIPYFIVGVDCNCAWTESNWAWSGYMQLYCDWVTSATKVTDSSKCVYTSATNLGHGLAGTSSGAQYATTASFSKGNTDTKTLGVSCYGLGLNNDNDSADSWGTCYVVVNFRDKAKLRQAYNFYLENAPILNPDYFTGTKYSDMMSYLNTVTDYLCNPYNTTAQSTMDTAATNLYNQVAAMKAAVTKPQSGDNSKFDYQDMGGTNHQGENRSDYVNTDTAYNRHYNTRTNALITGQGTNPETIPYFFGDTVTADKNNYAGYAFKYAEVTKPFDGAAICNNRSSNSEANKYLTWDAANKTLTFTNNTTGTDNFNQHPGPGADGSNYYYIPVIPKTDVILTYTATGTTSQVFMFGMGNDMKVPGTSWTDGQNLKSNYSTGNQTLKWTVPENIYYVTFRFGNQTANSTTTFSNIKITLKTAVPDEVNNAAGAGIEWKMYYDPNPSTVKYNPEGGTFNGSTNVSTTTVYYDDNYTVGKIGDSSPAAPTKAGYIFGGWLCNADGLTKPHGEEINPWKYDKPEVEFNAIWTPIKYNIDFNANGGTGTPHAKIENVQYGETVSIDNPTYQTFSYDGYDFIGWKVNNTGDLLVPDELGCVDVQNLTTTNNATVTLYAQWDAKKITLDLNGTIDGVSGGNITGYGTADVKVNGTVVGNDVTDFCQSINYGSSYEISDIKATKEGYYYSGLASGSGATSGTDVKTDTSVNLKFDKEKYNIRFAYNYDNAIYKEFNNQLYGSTIAAFADPTRTGYVFGGWFKETGCTNLAYSNTSSAITVGDLGDNNDTITYYAKWTANKITINYAANGGSGTNPGSHTFDYGTGVDPKANTFTPPTGYVVNFNVTANGGTGSNSSETSTYSFENWKSNTNNKTYAAGITTTDNFDITSGAVTLSAQWKMNAITLPTATKTGFKFAGWYDAQSGGTKKGDAGSNFTPTGATTLYAQFTAIDYTVTVGAYYNTIAAITTYSSGTTGGTVAGGGVYHYGDSLSGVTATPATGYKFDGWYTDSTFATSTSPSTMPDSNKTYIAKFSIDYCTVKAYAYSNTASATGTWANNATGGTVKVAAATTGSAAATSEGKVIKGNSATLTAEAATGYHFVGWYDSATVSGTAASSTNPLSVAYTSYGATVNKYARFDINTNTLIVKPNGGTWNGSTNDQPTTKEGGQILSIPVPTRTGYNFSKWTVSPSPLNGTLSSTTAAASYTFPTSVYGKTDTITATWTPITYTIAFNKKDANATGTTASMTNCEYDTSYTLTANGYTLTGYDFDGWNTASDGTGTKYADKASVSNLTTSDGATVTLYAQWKIKSYNVNLIPYANSEANPTTWTNTTAGGTVSGGGSKTYGSALSISATPATGYDFNGWYTEAPAGGTTWDDSKKITAPATTLGASDITYYARFSIKSFTVTAKAVADSKDDTSLKEVYASNAGCSAAPATSTVYYNKTVSLTATAGTGYEFKGWFDNEACTGNALSTSATYTTPAITAGKTYYAKFTVKSYNVTATAVADTATSTALSAANATAADCSAAPVSSTVKHGATVTLTATAGTGYEFKGWFDNSACTGTAISETTTFTPAITAAKDYYAKFTIKSYTVSATAIANSATDAGFTAANASAAGCTAASSASTAKHNTTVTLTATAATGYDFVGWFNNAAGTGSALSAAASYTPTITANSTFYAKFAIKNITVTFDANGGTVSSGSITATAYYGTPVATPNVIKQGYTLAGWDESSAATTATYPASSEIDVDDLVSAGANKTLYAVWKPYEYRIVTCSANNSSTNPGKFTVGETGGTIAVKSGETIVPGDDIESKLDITPATGYEFVEVRYTVTTTIPADNTDVTSWGTYKTSVSANKTMPEFEDNSTIVLIGYFEICQLNAKAYAYSNSASSDNYTNSAAGGTVQVKGGVINGTVGKESESAIYSGASVTFEAKAKTGYTFDGWYTAAPTGASWGTATSTSAALNLTMGGSDIIYYAKFSVKTRTVTAYAVYYNAGFDSAEGPGTKGDVGGTVTISTSSATATTDGSSAAVIQAKFNELVTYTAVVKTGYEFAGWYYGDDDDISDYASYESEATYDNYMPDEDVEIQGRFVPQNFVVKLEPNSGVSGTTAAITLTYNQPYTLDLTTKPLRTSYTFVGWSESSVATTPVYTYTDDICVISAATVNSWFSSGIDKIYAVWQIAKYIVTLDNQGGTGELTQVEVTYNEAMPALEKLPTYDGYTFAGYYNEPGGADASGKYYNEDGSSAKEWDIAGDGILYAKWVCPVLKDATFDEETGKWTYIYEDVNGGDVSSEPSDEILTEDGISQNAPSTAKQITSIDKAKDEYVKNKIDETQEINLNYYTGTALEKLYENVTATNTELKRNDLSQIELNAFVAKLARYTELEADENKKETEPNADTYKPTINLYETKDKIKSIKSSTLTKNDSVTGDNYSKPASNDAATFVYTNKWSEYEQGAVDYYIYTNSRTPVIALEIDDGTVGSTVSTNKSSYPTNSEIVAEGDSAVVVDKENSYMKSAVPATDDVNSAWFSRYTKANIGTKYDYNAKEIVYLTPSFTPTSTTSVTDEIVYTITPADDATNKNTGLTSAQIAEIPKAQADGFYSFRDDQQQPEDTSITVCICYHNTMNGTDDEGGTIDDPYLQMYIDQVDYKQAYADTWLNQMHLFRQSGGANNWEIVMADESVYPVDDETYRDTGVVLGSFAYVFDSSNEATATGYAEAGNFEAAKKEIISSISKKASDVQKSILSYEDANHIYDNGVGFFGLGGWSTNYYPRQGTYVYAHLIDRWGNVFNRVWKNFNVDGYTAVITGNVSNGFTVTEDGGSNVATITIGCDDVDFITDLDSTFNNDIFTTSGDTFTVITNKPKTNVSFAVTDNAGNVIKGKLPTDAEGNIKLTVKDLCADLGDGAYTFMLNDKEVNLNACDPSIVREASMPSALISGDPIYVTIKTLDTVSRVQLDENGATRTFLKSSSAATVVDNGDGTETWTIKIASLSKGDHTFAVNAKIGNDWYNSDFTVSTTIVSRPTTDTKAIISVENVNCHENEKISVKVEVKPETSAVRVTYDPISYTTTVGRGDCTIETTENGTEIWTVPAIIFAAEGVYEVNVYARYNSVWQTNLGAKCTVNVAKNAAAGAAIYNVKVSKTDLKRGEETTLTVVTNSATTRLQLVYCGTTTTYTKSTAQVTENEDGSLTWVINKSFNNYGDIDIVFKAKSSLGWTEEETFGTVTVTSSKAN